jgi:hypothetical protein
MLKSLEQIEEIPNILTRSNTRAVRRDYLWQPVEPGTLQMYLSRSPSVRYDKERKRKTS